MRIRPAREDDAQQLAQAEYETAAAQEGLLAARPHEISVEAFRSKIERLRDAGLYIVLESGDRLVGHLLLDPLEIASIRHVAQLTIVVHPGYTGRGYGKLLLLHAIEWARSSVVIEKIELRVRASNTRAIRLYESLGFEREGVLRRRIKTSAGYLDDICMALFVGPQIRE